MPTKRKRIRRKKTLRGGIPFIPGTKTVAENIRNCENYWSEGKPNNKYCRNKRYAGVISPDGHVVEEGDIDYPGRARQLLGYYPISKTRGKIERFEW